MESTSLKIYSNIEEVRSECKKNNKIMVVYEDNVYDVTDFQENHRNKIKIFIF